MSGATEFAPLEVVSEHRARSLDGQHIRRTEQDRLDPLTILTNNRRTGCYEQNMKCQNCDNALSQSQIKLHGKYCSRSCSRQAYSRSRRAARPSNAWFWARVASGGQDECWNWAGSKSKSRAGGYGRFRRVGTGLVQAHRHAFEISGGGLIPPGFFVIHSCDNPSCCNPAHLRLGTCMENNQDMKKKFRHEHGIIHHNAKLTDDIVREIRTRRKPLRSYAEQFGVTVGTVWSATVSRTWKHVA